MKNKQKHTTLSQLRKNLELGEIYTIDTQLQALQWQSDGVKPGLYNDYKMHMIIICMSGIYVEIITCC
jgi:hypothetical protein